MPDLRISGDQFAIESGRTYVRACDGGRVSSDGTPYGRFQRAIKTRKLLLVAAAAELERLTLADAFAVCLVFLPDEPDRFGRALVRWHALLP